MLFFKILSVLIFLSFVAEAPQDTACWRWKKHPRPRCNLIVSGRGRFNPSTTLRAGKRL